MVEAPRPKSYLNAPPSLCLLELFFPFFALFHPAKRRKKLESSLFISPAAGPRNGGGAASLAGRGVECVRALSYVPREARTAKDMATKRGAEEWVRKRVIRGVTRGRRRRRGKKKLIFFAFRGAPVSRASLTELSSRRLHHHHRPTAAPAPVLPNSEDLSPSPPPFLLFLLFLLLSRTPSSHLTTIVPNGGGWSPAGPCAARASSSFSDQ